MLKKLIKPIKDVASAGVLAMAAVVVILLLAVVAGYYFILPSWNDLQKANEANEQNQEKLDLISSNTTALAALNKPKIATYAATLNRALPAEADQARVATLLTVLASSVGGTISNIQASGQVASQANSSTPVPITNTTTPSATGYSIAAVFQGSFQSFQAFLETLRAGDRVIQTTQIAISPVSSSNDVKAALTLTLPISNVAAALNPEEVLSLSSSEESEIQQLSQKILYESQPGSLPLSRTNPFAGY